jgi:hypothetical protein
MQRLVLALCAGCIGAFGSACASRSVPDPKVAAAAYAKAAARGDSSALYAMMTSSARKARSKDDVDRLVAEERGELAEQARAIASKDARVDARARLRFEDGEEAALDLREGRFWVTSAGTMPGGAATPEEALDELRRVVARRSYAGLVRVLSPSTRAAIEEDLRALVTGLERPDTLQVQTNGDAASANVPGGHHVRLKREGGIWRIQDFD